MSRTPRVSSEMNITPMIDVLLVLLVIFMAALPLDQRSHDVTLPQPAKDPATLPYEHVMSVIDAAKGAGISRVGIVTESMRRASR